MITLGAAARHRACTDGECLWCKAGREDDHRETVRALRQHAATEDLRARMDEEFGLGSELRRMAPFGGGPTPSSVKAHVQRLLDQYEADGIIVPGAALSITTDGSRITVEVQASTPTGLECVTGTITRVAMEAGP